MHWPRPPRWWWRWGSSSFFVLGDGSDSGLDTAAFGPNQALALTDDYLEVYNDGDVVAMDDLVIPGTQVVTPAATLDSAQFHAFYLSQGAKITGSNCTSESTDAEAEDEAAEGEVEVVTCDLTFHDVLDIAVDGPPWEGNLTLTITADGISGIQTQFSVFGSADRAFDLWLQGAHRDDYNEGGLRFNAWDSVEHARRGGALRSERAAEYAAFLESSNCAYDDHQCVVDAL